MLNKHSWAGDRGGPPPAGRFGEGSQTSVSRNVAQDAEFMLNHTNRMSLTMSHS
jgi:hypothetical protein